MGASGRQAGALDEIDAAILTILAADGRIAMKDLAVRVGLSPPSTADRVRRLEDVGAIVGYQARIDPVFLGFPVAVYIRIRPLPGKLPTVVETLAQRPEVVSCDRVTGDDCLVAQAMLASVRDLEPLLDQLLPIATTTTSLIQSRPICERLPGRAAARTTSMPRRRAP